MSEENKLTPHQQDRRRAKDLLKEVREVRASYDNLAEQVSDALDEIQQIKENQNVVPETEKFTNEYGHLVTCCYKRDTDGTILFQDSYTNDRGLHESSHWQEYDADEDWKNPVSS